MSSLFFKSMLNNILKLIKKTAFITYLVAISFVSFAQAKDEAFTLYEEGFIFKEGIYNSFDEFKSNRPSINYKAIKKGSKVYYELNDSLVQIIPTEVWGYSLMGKVYISSEGVFWKCINIGSLTQFTEVTINDYLSTDAYGYSRQVQTKSLNQSFLDMNTGFVYVMNYKNLKPYIEKEPTLAKYIKRNRKAKHQELILVLRAYNKLNPLYIPSHE